MVSETDPFLADAVKDPDLLQKEADLPVRKESVGRKKHQALVCADPLIAFFLHQVVSKIVRDQAQVELCDLKIGMVRGGHLDGNVSFSPFLHIGKEFRCIRNFQSCSFYALKSKTKTIF